MSVTAHIIVLFKRVKIENICLINLDFSKMINDFKHKKFNK